MTPTVYLLLSKNQLVLPDETVIQCRRQWAGVLLFLLAQQKANYPQVTLAQLQIELLAHGHAEPPSRQHLRLMVKDIEACLSQIPNQPVMLEYGQGKTSTGPWRLLHRAPCVFQRIQSLHDIPQRHLKHQHGLLLNQPDHQATHSPYVHLLKTVNPCALREFLHKLLLSDALAAEGDFDKALEMLEPCFLNPNISPDLRGMLLLRYVSHEKALGHFAQARLHVAELLSQPDSHYIDNGLKGHARFYLERITYDESPATAYQQLWQNPAPPYMFSINLRTAAEWHNLRALLTRRVLLDPKTKSSEHLALHHSAMRHFEAAIYWSLSFKDYERTQAMVGNLAFYLHKTSHLGYTDVHKIYDWYVLFMDYAIHLDVGRNTAWEYIFLAQFWLDHEQEINAKQWQNRLLLERELHPRHENFYLRAIDKLKDCADARQVGIAWINYKRYAQKYLGQHKVVEIKNTIAFLLKTHPLLKRQLKEDGYAAYL